MKQHWAFGRELIVSSRHRVIALSSHRLAVAISLVLALFLACCHPKGAQAPLVESAATESAVETGQPAETPGADIDEITKIQSNMMMKERLYIREGQSSTGRILYNIDGNYIRETQSSTGRILYNIDGNWIRETQSSTGRILYNIDGNYIRETQSSTGRILYNIDGNYVRETQSSTGRIVCNISRY